MKPVSLGFERNQGLFPGKKQDDISRDRVISKKRDMPRPQIYTLTSDFLSTSIYLKKNVFF